MTKKEMLNQKLREMENLKAEIEQLRAEIKAEEVPTTKKELIFDSKKFENLLDREEGKEMLKDFSTPELKQIAKMLSVKLLSSKRSDIVDRIVEIVIGGNIRRYTLDNMTISENLGYNEF